MNEPRQTAMPLAIEPGAYAAVPTPPCRERKDLDATAACVRKIDIAIDVLTRHAAPSNPQRHGVRLARRIHPRDRRQPPRTREAERGRAAAAGPDPLHHRRHRQRTVHLRRPGRQAQTYLKLNTDHIAAAHRIHVAVNRDPRFRRYETGSTLASTKTRIPKTSRGTDPKRT